MTETLTQVLRRQGVSRRSFLKFCSLTAASLGLAPTFASKIAYALDTSPREPVIWLHGLECTCCSESFIRSAHPLAKDVVLSMISLDYDDTIMAASGLQAEAIGSPGDGRSRDEPPSNGLPGRARRRRADRKAAVRGDARRRAAARAGGPRRGSLVASRVDEAIALALAELRAWGARPSPRTRPAEPILAESVARHAYDGGRPSEEEACRIGDERFLPRRSA